MKIATAVFYAFFRAFLLAIFSINSIMSCLNKNQQQQ